MNKQLATQVITPPRRHIPMRSSRNDEFRNGQRRGLQQNSSYRWGYQSNQRNPRRS